MDWKTAYDFAVSVFSIDPNTGAFVRNTGFRRVDSEEPTLGGSCFVSGDFYEANLRHRESPDLSIYAVEVPTLEGMKLSTKEIGNQKFRSMDDLIELQNEMSQRGAVLGYAVISEDLSWCLVRGLDEVSIFEKAV